MICGCILKLKTKILIWDGSGNRPIRLKVANALKKNQVSSHPKAGSSK